MLLVTALQALDTLSTWSDPLRHWLLNWHPNILFLGSFSYWLLGPLLYGYVASVLYRQIRFRAIDLLHLLPAVIAGVSLVRHYDRRPAEAQLNLLWDMSFMWTPLMESLVSFWRSEERR